MSEPPFTPRHDRRERRRYNREKAALRQRTNAELVAEFQLAASVAGNGQDSEAWLEIKSRVWTYSARTLPALIRDGRVWVRHRELGGIPARVLAPPPYDIEFEDAHDLAVRAVMAALRRFPDQLLTGKWDPAGGADLTTWFNNLCILCLPSPWRSWRSERARRGIATEIDPAPVADTSDGPEAVIYDLEIERYVEILNEHGESLGDDLRLDAAGLTDAEIADAVGRTIKSVEYRRSKARTLARRRRQSERRLDQFRDIADNTA